MNILTHIAYFRDAMNSTSAFIQPIRLLKLWSIEWTGNSQYWNTEMSKIMVTSRLTGPSLCYTCLHVFLGPNLLV